MPSYAGEAWVSLAAWNDPDLREHILRDMIRQMSEQASARGHHIARRETTDYPEVCYGGEQLRIAIRVQMIGWTDDGEPETKG